MKSVTGFLMLELLDILFIWLHIIIICFNLFGWVWHRTRKLHLIFVFVTLFSWIVLGLKYGFGYCFITDWHWSIKRHLGQDELPASFVKFFLDQYTSITLSAEAVDWLTGISFGIAIFCSIYLNFIYRSKPKNN